MNSKDVISIDLSLPDPSGEEHWFDTGCYSIDVETTNSLKTIYIEDAELAKIVFDFLLEKYGKLK